MTCRTCTHAAERATAEWARVLWCARWRTVPTRACGEWLREPGAN